MAASRFRYVDGIDADSLPMPNVEQARLPVNGQEPHELPPEPKLYGNYSEMKAARWTSPTDR
jgi:hypothetical protein